LTFKLDSEAHLLEHVPVTTVGAVAVASGCASPERDDRIAELPLPVQTCDVLRNLLRADSLSSTRWPRGTELSVGDDVGSFLWHFFGLSLFMRSFPPRVEVLTWLMRTLCAVLPFFHTRLGMGCLFEDGTGRGAVAEWMRRNIRRGIPSSVPLEERWLAAKERYSEACNQCVPDVVTHTYVLVDNNNSNNNSTRRLTDIELQHWSCWTKIHELDFEHEVDEHVFCMDGLFLLLVLRVMHAAFLRFSCHEMLLCDADRKAAEIFRTSPFLGALIAPGFFKLAQISVAKAVRACSCVTQRTSGRPKKANAGGDGQPRILWSVELRKLLIFAGHSLRLVLGLAISDRANDLSRHFPTFEELSASTSLTQEILEAHGCINASTAVQDQCFSFRFTAHVQHVDINDTSQSSAVSIRNIEL
jgi:hypothetical protein